MRRRGLLTVSAALVLIVAVTACAMRFINKEKEDTGQSEDTVASYVYGTMDRYLAAPSVPATAGSYTQHLVTVTSSPASGGKVTPGTYVVDGSELTLTAAANEGYMFTGWSTDSGSSIVSTSAKYVTAPVSADVTYTAVFKRVSCTVIPYAAVESDTPVASSCLGGYVTGGGMVSETVTTVVSAVANDGYSFQKWKYIKPDGTEGESAEASPSVGLEGSGAQIEISSSDSTIYAVFIRTAPSDASNVVITASIVPSMGHIKEGGSGDMPSESGSSTTVFMSKRDSIDPPYLNWYVPVGDTSKHGSTETTPEYSYREIIIEYDVLDNGKKAVRRISVGQNDDGKGDASKYDYDNGSGRGYICLQQYLYGLNVNSFVNVYVIYKAYDASFERTYSLTTAASPEGYGSTSGDMSNSSSFTGNANATPKEGYAFDHWEWVEENGNLRQSTDNPLSVSVTGQITCIAYFTQATCRVDVASVTPAAGGIVSKGIGSYKYNSDAAVEISANEGYEFESCSYTTKDGITHSFDSSVFTIPKIKEDIFLNVQLKQTKFLVSAKPEPLGNEEGSFNKVKISNGSTDNETDATNTTVEMPLASSGSVTLTATANTAAGYKFDKWVGTDGSTSTSNPFNPAGIQDDVTYTARFVKDKYVISVYAEPETNGSAYVYDASSTSASNRLTRLEVEIGQSARIEAKENDGYEFLYWTTSSGTRLYEKTVTLTDIKSDETFTAHFSTELQVVVGHTPDGAAEVKLDVEGGAAGSFAPDGTYTIKYGDSVVLTAKATDETKYRFVRWQDGSGFNYTENPVKIVNVTSPDTFVAVYEPIKCTISVNEDPVDGGKAYVKGEGSSEYKRGSDEVETGKGVQLKAEPSDGYSFLYWTSSTGTRYTDNELSISNVGNNETFTAHFGKQTATLNIYTTPDGAGEVQLSGVTRGGSGAATVRDGKLEGQQVDGGTNATLTAFSRDENKYRFTRWVDSKGNSYSTNPLELVNIVADETYTAVFSSATDVNSITVKASPPEGGTVSKYVGEDGSTTIKAEANDGYSFLYWMTSSGTKLTASETAVSNVGWDEVYTAYFGKTKVTVNAAISPSDAGTVKAAGTENGASKTDTGASISGFTVDGGTNVTLTAFAVDENKYKFVKWEDSRGNSYSTNPLELVDVEADETYTAVYSSTGDVNEITVKASPPEGGQVSKVINGDGTTTINAMANAGFSFMYWLSSSGTKMTEAQVTLSNVGWNEVFTAYFSKENVRVTIDVSPSDSGMVELNDNGYVSSETTYDIEGGSNITLRAQSNDSTRFKFDRWEDSRGNFYSDNPLTVVDITADEKFTAVFTPIDEEVGFSVKASPPSGGRLSMTKNSDGTFTIKAQPNSGYIYKGWYLGDKKLTDSTTYTIVNVKDGDVYIARFEIIKGYDARTDISRERFANVTRIFTAPYYTVTRATMEIMASSQVALDRQLEGNPAPGSREYGAYSTVREMNAKKYDKSHDRSALLIDEVLVTTHGDIVSVITIEDPSAEEKSAQFTQQKFGDRYKYEILTIKQITATEEFARTLHTYLLKDTGVKFQDNVYILFGSENGRNSNSGIKGFDWVTCVADEAGTLRFTIPSFVSGDEFIVVRVWPE